jgi:hypothetical protein
LIYPAGTSGKLDVANVTPTLVALVIDTFAVTLPLLTVTLARVRLPTELVVPPNVRVVLPSVRVLLARPLLGMVNDVVTGLVLLAYMYPVRVVTVRLVTFVVSPASTFCQMLPLKTAQSPTPHKVVPFRLVEPATDTT